MCIRDRVQEAERRIFEHPGYLELVRCETLRRTLTAVFVPNWQELLALLDRAATDVGLALELIQNVHRPDVRERFEAATVQRLHNYVAGTMTLVDHTRRIMRARSGAIPDEFAKRKALLLANPEVPFVPVSYTHLDVYKRQETKCAHLKLSDRPRRRLMRSVIRPPGVGGVLSTRSTRTDLALRRASRQSADNEQGTRSR